MGSSLYKAYIHIIFGTQNYEKLIPSGTLTNLHSYIASILKKRDCYNICVGGISNHVHILTSLPKTISISEMVKTIKLATHNMLVKKYNITRFTWQNGYAIFSVSPTEIQRVKNYIKNKKNHHIKTSYEKELKFIEMILRKFGV